MAVPHTMVVLWPRHMPWCLVGLVKCNIILTPWNRNSDSICVSGYILTCFSPATLWKWKATILTSRHVATPFWIFYPVQKWNPLSGKESLREWVHGRDPSKHFPRSLGHSFYVSCVSVQLKIWGQIDKENPKHFFTKLSPANESKYTVGFEEDAFQAEPCV